MKIDMKSCFRPTTENDSKKKYASCDAKYLPAISDKNREDKRSKPKLGRPLLIDGKEGLSKDVDWFGLSQLDAIKYVGTEALMLTMFQSLDSGKVYVRESTGQWFSIETHPFTAHPAYENIKLMSDDPPVLTKVGEDDKYYLAFYR